MISSTELSVVKIHLDIACDLLNATKILEENASKQLKYLSKIHLCAKHNSQVNKSSEKIYFNLIWHKVFNLQLNDSINNDCGEKIGFNSTKGYKDLDTLIPSLNSIYKDKFCASKCAFSSRNTTSDTLRGLCPTCLECMTLRGETDQHRGCSTNGVCAGEG